MRIGDILRHANHSPDLKVGSVKCFDLYIIVLVLISKDLGNKQICWTILANLWPTSGTVWEGVLRVSGQYLEGVLSVSGGYLKGNYVMSKWYRVSHKKVYPFSSFLLKI